MSNVVNTEIVSSNIPKTLKNTKKYGELFFNYYYYSFFI